MVVTDHHAWLIRLRWVAIIGVVFAALFAAAHGWILSATPLVAVAGLMTMANLGLVFLEREVLIEGATRRFRRDQIFALQICLDLCFLTMLLHWTGGIENPFAIFFVFHMAISAISFELRRALFFCLVAVMLFGGTILLEASAVIPHYPLLLDKDYGESNSWRSTIYVVGYLIAFTLALFGIIAFVSKVQKKRIDAEAHAHDREMVALSRERLARVGELSAGVAHSVRNPLHGAMNCLSMLRMGPAGEDPDSLEALELMGEGLSRIESVTRRLLTYSGNRVLNCTATDINELVQDSVTFIDPRLTRAQVTVHLNLGNLPLIEIDREKIGEILINLMDNAVFACKEDGNVTINTSLVKNAEDRVLIEVIDTGEGIAAENLRTVFDPLFTTKAVGEGSGMGLAIARRVVEEHGGKITINSKLGEFTIIQVLLPLTPTTSSDELET